MEWCREKVICLISLFEERPCLWDKSHKYYRDRDAKNAAMLEISEQLGLSCIEVERKLNTLLTQYRREKHVQRKMESAGCVVKKPWFGYNLLKFLETAENKYFNKWSGNPFQRSDNASCSEPDVSLQRSLYNADNVSLQQSLDGDNLPNANEPEIVMEHDSVNETLPRPLRESRKRKRSPERNRNKIGQAYRILKSAYREMQNRDDLKIFAEGVEARLRKIQNKKKVCVLKHQIETLLFTAEIEEFSHSSSTLTGPNEAGHSFKIGSDESGRFS